MNYQFNLEQFKDPAFLICQSPAYLLQIIGNPEISNDAYLCLCSLDEQLAKAGFICARTANILMVYEFPPHVERGMAPMVADFLAKEFIRLGFWCIVSIPRNQAQPKPLAMYGS